jgi:two-component system, chemotaxis family, sensor kinase CheA
MREESLIREFIAEAEEHVLRLEPQLLQLEETPENRALVQEIFVATHAIKGTAAYVGLDHISAFTHLLESVLDRLRHQELTVSADLIDSLLRGLDSVQRLIQHVAAGKPPPDTAESEHQLARWLAPPGASADEQRLSPPHHTDSSSAHERVGDLARDELQALDPEDVEILADIISQQLAAMRLCCEHLEHALTPDADSSARSDARSAATGLVTAFQRIQSSALMAPMPSFHAALARYAPVFAALEHRDTLSPQDCQRLGQTLDALDQMADWLTGEPQPAPRSAPPDSPADLPDVSTPAEELVGSPMLRVDVGRIDALLNLTGELVANRARLAHVEHVLTALYEDVRTGSDAFLKPCPNPARSPCDSSKPCENR